MQLFTDSELSGRPQPEVVRDEAIAQVYDHANPDWREAAGSAIATVASRQIEFTTDDVWDALIDAPGTHEPRALGAIIRAAAAQGICVKTDRVVNSRRVECHCRPVAVWRSLIWKDRYDCA